MNNLTPFTAEYKKRMNAVYKNIEKFNHKDIIDVVNRNPQTFNGYGPYTKMDGYWKALNISPHNNSPMEFQKKILEYTKQIEEQKKYIEKLESQIEQLIKKQ